MKLTLRNMHLCEMFLLQMFGSGLAVLPWNIAQLALCNLHHKHSRWGHDNVDVVDHIQAFPYALVLSPLVPCECARWKWKQVEDILFLVACMWVTRFSDKFIVNPSPVCTLYDIISSITLSSRFATKERPISTNASRQIQQHLVIRLNIVRHHDGSSSMEARCFWCCTQTYKK